MKIRKKKAVPDEVDCRYCTEYIHPVGCTALKCPYFRERIEAGTVGYEELIANTFYYRTELYRRLQTSIKTFPGTMWADDEHESRFLYATAGSYDVFLTPHYYAAVYLLTADADLYHRCSGCFMKSGVYFRNVRIQGISPFGYTLYSYAKMLNSGRKKLPTDELTDTETISDEAFTLIVNAAIIAKFGTDILKTTKTTTER